MAKSRIVRTESNPAFHKSTFQKTFGCVNTTEIPQLLLIEAYARQVVYT